MSKLNRIEPSALKANPRATLKAWEKYQPMIYAAIETHPRPYIFKPSNMAASTVVSRARDAVRGAIAFSYPSTISTPDLAHWYSEVIFKSDRESVYIGKPEEVSSILQGSGNDMTVDRTYSFPTLSFEEVSAFCLLLSTSRLEGPVTISSPPDLSLLPPRPNVEMLQRPDGSLILL